MNVIPVSANPTKSPPSLMMSPPQQHRPLDTEQLPPKRTYVLSNMIPFGAHLVVERIACDLGDWEPDPNVPTGPEDGDGNGNGNGNDNSERQRDGKKDYVRIYLKWVWRRRRISFNTKHRRFDSIS
jgi:hypothetical protein